VNATRTAAKKRPPMAGTRTQPQDSVAAKEARQHGRTKLAKTNGFEVKVTVKPVVAAIRILGYLTEGGRSAKVTEIAREFKLNRSTCFNILRTLVGEGILEFDPSATSYKIGFGMVKLAESIHTEGDRLSAVRPYMHELADKFGVNVTLWRRTGLDRMVLASTESSSRDLRIHMRVGQRLPLLLGATGRAIATHLGMSKAQVRAQYKQLRWARSLTFNKYWRESLEARERGWAIDDGYFSAGITALAAPVFGPNGDVAFSLVAVMFRSQYDKDVIERLGKDLKIMAGHFTSLLF